MKFIGEYLVVALIGAAVGAGTYTVFDWQWWVWMVPITVALQVHDTVIKP